MKPLPMSPAAGIFADRLKDTEPTPEFSPTYRLEEYVAEARRQMGERRWADLMREWDA